MEKGKRFNKGKLRWSLLPLWLLEGVVKVLMFGSKKYGDFNWQKGMPISEVYESCQRHLVKFMQGQDIDEESGERHIDHAICNLIIILYTLIRKPEFDDRLKNDYITPERGGLKNEGAEDDIIYKDGVKSSNVNKFWYYTDKWSITDKVLMSKMTKIPFVVLDQIDRLPSGIREKYIKNFDRDYYGEVCITKSKSLKLAIAYGFDWGRSNEGYSFWKKVTDLYG